MKAQELVKILEKAPEMDVLLSLNHTNGYQIAKIAVVGESILLIPKEEG